MSLFLNLFAVALLVVFLVEARDTAEHQKKLDDEQMAREALRKKLMDEGKWTSELEQAHVLMFRAVAKEMFQAWCGPNSFKFALTGAIATLFFSLTSLPGAIAGGCIASPRMNGYWVRALHILLGRAS